MPHGPRGHAQAGATWQPPGLINSVRATLAEMSTWRNAGLSFLKYSQLCAQHVRDALKEPMKSKKITSEGVTMRLQKFEGGKKVATGTCAWPTPPGRTMGANGTPRAPFPPRDAQR